MAFPWAAAAGLVGGLFGGNEAELPDEVKRLLRLQQRIARDLYKFSKTAPGTAPGELAMLAQARGLMGEQFSQQREQLGALSGPELEGAGTDRYARFLEGQQGALGNLTSQFFMGAQQDRRQAAMQAAGIAGQAAGTASGAYQAPQGGFAQLLGQLSNQLAYINAMKSASRPLDNSNRGSGTQQTPANFGVPSPIAGNYDWQANRGGGTGFGSDYNWWNRG